MTRLWAAYQSRFSADDKGASMVVIAGAVFFGTELSESFSEVGDTVSAT